MNARRFASLLFICLSFAVSFADNNDKFIKDATKEVWSMDLPYFNPNTVVPDSVSSGHSAVIIADYMLIDADFSQNTSFTKAYNLGNSVANVTKCKTIRRCMVKLLDDAAIEDFSSVNLGTGADKALIGSYQLAMQNEAFGARVHKPDGSVVDVDVSKALKVTEGKKGKDEVTRRLQIPGLAVGDVLEFFTFNYDELDELSLSPKRVDIIQKYPVMKYVLQTKFAPELTVEYRTVNGAPLLDMGYDSRGNMVASAEFENLPAIPTNKFFLSCRQLPYYRFSIMNNNTEMLWRPKLSRNAGLYPDIVAGTYYREIGEVLQRFKPSEDLINSTVKYMKKYMKNHPEDSRRALIDRAWSAMLYYFMTNKKVGGGDLTKSTAFAEILRKLKLDGKNTGVGFANSRLSFPTDCLLSYRDVDYFAIADSIPYCATEMDCFAPGEFPGFYQGETGGAFFDSLTGQVVPNPQSFTLPTSTFNSNVLYNAISLSIDTNADSDELPINYEMSVLASGAAKDLADITIGFNVWTEAFEDFLDLPESERYKFPESDRHQYDEAQAEHMLDASESILGVRPAKLTSHSVSDLGCLPNAKKMKYQTSGIIDGLVSDAGDGELLVNIGKLFGKNTKLIGNDRIRQYDAFLFAPYQTIYAVVLNVPEGYTVDESSIEALNSNLNNPVGCYQVKANLSEDGRTISLQTLERKMHYVVPAGNWTDLLDIYDASAAFNDTAIILTPAQ